LHPTAFVRRQTTASFFPWWDAEGHPILKSYFGNSQAVQKIKKVSKNKEFFFEKKNQKTFAPRRQGRSKATGQKLLKFFCFFLFTKRSSFFFCCFLR
jgi:hypothetical protein